MIHYDARLRRAADEAVYSARWGRHSAVEAANITTATPGFTDYHIAARKVSPFLSSDWRVLHDCRGFVEGRRLRLIVGRMYVRGPGYSGLLEGRLEDSKCLF